MTGAKQKRRLVDGGYSDNSGVATALDVITRLQKVARLLSGVERVLRRGSSCWRSSVLLNEDTADTISYSFGEVVTPLRALDSIRSARGRLAVAQAELLLDGANCSDPTPAGQAPCQTEGNARTVVLATGDVPVPLGWVLSDRSRKAIECSFGIPELCHLKQAKQRTVRMRENNNAVIRQIRAET